MANLKPNKQKITEAILAEIPKTHRIYHELPIEEVIFKWWFTGRQEGLRLTDAGVTAFELANIEFYDHDFSQNGQSYFSFILALNKKIKCPYYLGVKRSQEKSSYIRLYDSKIAMMVKLYGNLQEYLESIKEKR